MLVIYTYFNHAQIRRVDLHGFLSAMWDPNYHLASGAAAFVSLAQRLGDMPVIVPSSPLVVIIPGQHAD